MNRIPFSVQDRTCIDTPQSEKCIDIGCVLAHVRFTSQSETKTYLREKKYVNQIFFRTRVKRPFDILQENLELHDVSYPFGVSGTLSLLRTNLAMTWSDLCTLGLTRKKDLTLCFRVSTLSVPNVQYPYPVLDICVSSVPLDVSSTDRFLPLCAPCLQQICRRRVLKSVNFSP